MTLRDYGRVLTEQWRLLAAGLVVGVVVAAALAVLLPTRYSSQSTLYFSAAAPPGDLTAAYDGLLLAREKANIYVPLVTQDRVTDAVASRLGLDGDTVAASLTAFAPPETPLLTVSATATSPEGAQVIARTAADVLVELVPQVEQPLVAPTAVAPQGISASVVQPATFSAAALSLGAPLRLLLGAVLGLVAGAVVALVRNAGDTSLRTPSAVQEVTGVPVLGAVGGDRARRRRGTLDSGADPRQAEAFSHLRAALTHLVPGALDGLLVVTSTSPGEGRTSVVRDLAGAVADTGRSVLVVDADLRSAGPHASANGGEQVGLRSVLAGRAAADDAIRPGAGTTVDVLPAGAAPFGPADVPGSDELRSLLEDVTRRYDTVLVDTPPLLPAADAALTATSGRRVLLVVSCGRSTPEDVEQGIEVLRAVGASVEGTVLTRSGRRAPTASRSTGRGGGDGRWGAQDAVTVTAPRTGGSVPTTDSTVPTGTDRGAPAGSSVATDSAPTDSSVPAVSGPTERKAYTALRPRPRPRS